MDWLALLGTVRGKVLDANNFDLLKGIYELQNENIAQLKTQNELLRSNLLLVNEKLEKTIAENVALSTDNKNLLVRIGHDEPKQEVTLTDLQWKILKLYLRVGEASLWTADLTAGLGVSKLEIESAMDDFKNHDIATAGIFGDRGECYYLSDAGKKLALAAKQQSP